jgi:aspartate/methionine/tyrosine aminotransferase
VIVSSPHNPSGAVASRSSLDALARLAETRGFSVLVDEVYAETVESGPPPPAATLSSAFVSTNSLTKAYGLSALRCGWSIASPERTEAIRRARDVVDGSGSVPLERLAALAFHHRESLQERSQALLSANRSLWRDFVGRVPELLCAPSEASIAFPGFADGRDAGAFAERLLEREGVAVAPGAFFGAPAHFRVAIGGDTEKLRAGLDATASLIRGG